MERGRRNTITDVPGVLVGHCTVDDLDKGVHTGVTAVIPADGSLFRGKLAAGASVMNGFGKSVGLMQVEEKGTLETPIILTGVSSVGSMVDALFRLSMDNHEEICKEGGSINPLVCECNDSYLNNARATFLGRGHLEEALCKASSDFAQGSVGAGRGMSCFQLKGGIGSASRVVNLPGRDYSLGVLVNANFGELGCLSIHGKKVGEEIAAKLKAEKEREKGSIIVVIATDAPFDSRQLKRISKRSFIGIGRTGSFVGDGSGDLAVAFSTASRIPHTSASSVLTLPVLHEDHINPFFKAAAEATEEAVLNALFAAEPLVGRDGNRRRALSEFLP